MNPLKLVHSSLVCLLVLAFQANLSFSQDKVAGATAPEVAKAVPSNPIRLIVPPVVHAVPGIEANVYFDNICLAVNPANFVFDVQCTKGRQHQERWTLTPTDADVGDLPLSVEVRNDQNQIIAKASTVVRVVPTKSGDGQNLSLLCIGDSLTHASVYPAKILERSKAAGNPKLELVGSHWIGDAPNEVRHEGYGGWTALRFATHFTETARMGDYAKRGSPFLYPQPGAKPKLDFQRYCQDVNGGKMPSHVTIFLGPNDIFSYDDSTIEAGIDTMLSHYDQLVNMVRTTSPTTRLGVMLPVPPAASQDAFGANYASGQTRWQYKRNQHRLVERMLEKYGQRESEQIDLVATYVSLDCVHNYPSAQVSPNAHASTKIIRQNNGVHPDVTGYSQIADSVYAWLKATSAK